MDLMPRVGASLLLAAFHRVLDTCTGLAYTAIAAARCPGVSEVVTIELDDVSLRMCARNPWSRDLFENDKITSVIGDCCEASPVSCERSPRGWRRGSDFHPR